MALRTPCAPPIGVPALAELLDDLCAEGGQVVGAAAGDEPLVDDHLLVDHVRARVAQVRRHLPRRISEQRKTVMGNRNHLLLGDGPRSATQRPASSIASPTALIYYLV